MIKIVLDTNMFISAFLYHGMTKIIFDLVLDNKLALYISSQLKQEILEKFRKFGASEEMLTNITIFLSSKGIMTAPSIKITICRDPKDNFLLELSETVKADYLITRDKDLLELPKGKWKETKIVKPETFLPILRKMELVD